MSLDYNWLLIRKPKNVPSVEQAKQNKFISDSSEWSQLSIINA